MLCSTPSHTPPTVTDFGETGLQFKEKMFSGFASDVYQLLCLESLLFREFPEVTGNWCYCSCYEALLAFQPAAWKRLLLLNKLSRVWRREKERVIKKEAGMAEMLAFSCLLELPWIKAFLQMQRWSSCWIIHVYMFIWRH